MNNALVVRNLIKRFGGLVVTDDVSLTVESGQRRLLIGPNGAGKTTLFNLLSGDLRADAGSIAVFGEDVTSLRSDQRAWLGMSRTYQIITLFANNSVGHNISLSLLGRSAERWNPFRRLSTYASFREDAAEILERVGLRHVQDRRLSELSYGEKRRVEIAMALAQRPRLLLLDEPLAGLSQEERRDVHAVLSAIPRDVTILMIEHDMDIALEFADYITLLHQGKVITQGTRAEIVAHPATREIYLGQ